MTRSILFLVYLIGLYTSIMTPVGTVMFYGSLHVTAGVLLFVLNVKSVVSYLKSLVILLIIVLASVFLGDAGIDYLPSGMRAGVQLVLSIVSGAGAAMQILRTSRKKLSKLFFSLVCGVILLGLLEVYGGLQPFSDSFRETVFSSERAFLYSSDGRDEELHGSVRPKVFTQEPSHPAKFVSVLLVGWYLLSSYRKKEILFVSLLLTAFFVLRSPSLIVAGVCYGYFYIFPVRAASYDRRKIVKAVALLLIFTSVVTVEHWAWLLPFERMQAISDGADTSSIMRLVAPVAICVQVLSDNLFFGAGLGGADAVRQVLIDVYKMYPGVDMNQFYDSDTAGWGNAFFQFWTLTGLVGGVSFLYWLVRFSGRFCRDPHLVLMLFAVIFNFDSTFVLPRPWAYFFILLAVVKYVGEDRRAGLDSRREQT